MAIIGLSALSLPFLKSSLVTLRFIRCQGGGESTQLSQISSQGSPAYTPNRFLIQSGIQLSMLRGTTTPHKKAQVVWSIKGVPEKIDSLVMGLVVESPSKYLSEGNVLCLSVLNILKRLKIRLDFFIFFCIW